MEGLIKKDRPNITNSSIKQYITNYKMLKTLLKIENDNLDIFKNVEEVIETLETINKITTRKNLITTIIVLLKAKKYGSGLIDKYTNKLKLLNEEYKKKLDNQELTQSQKELWVDYEVIIDLSNKLLKKVNEFKNKDILDQNEMRTLMDLVIIRSYIISPARNSYSDMKVAEEDDDLNEKHNYILLDEYGNPKQFIFNIFKNVKSLGQRKVNIDTETSKIIKLWLKHNTSGEFLITLKDEPMTSNYLTQYLSSMFNKYIGKPISSSMLRHIIISYDLRNTPTIKEKEKTEEEIKNKYQHSGSMNQLYRKIN